MDQERLEDSNRLRVVENAIIKIEQIMELVVVDLKGRVRDLEVKDEETTQAMYASCDNKTKEIDSKMWNCLSKSFIGQAFLFTLFIGAVVYFEASDREIKLQNNTEHKELLANINKYNADTIKNTVINNNVSKLLHKIDDKVNELPIHTHKK